MATEAAPLEDSPCLNLDAGTEQGRKSQRGSEEGHAAHTLPVYSHRRQRRDTAGPDHAKVVEEVSDEAR